MWVIGVPTGRVGMSGTGAWRVGGVDFMSFFCSGFRFVLREERVLYLGERDERIVGLR